MPIPDKVRIKHPRRHNQGSAAVPLTFLAFGTAQGSLIQSVKGEIQKLRPAGSPVIQGTTLYFKAAPVGSSDGYRWLIKFVVPAGSEGQYRLKVNGRDAAQNTVCRDRVTFGVGVTGHDLVKEPVRALGVPSILYPNPNQNIIDERDYFCAYGNRGGNAVTAVTVTPPGAGDISGEFDQIPAEDFWMAVFDLSALEPDLDPIVLRVVNGTGPTAQDICILA